MALSVQQSQRQLIACALEVLADADFALAGSGAIREHGMTQRPTNDIDLFTVMHAATRFPNAVDSLIEHLAAHNYDVTVERATPSFAQLSVTPQTGHHSALISPSTGAPTHPSVSTSGPSLTLLTPSATNSAPCTPGATHATTSTSMRSAPPEQSPMRASSNSCRNAMQALTKHSSQSVCAEQATSA